MTQVLIGGVDQVPKAVTDATVTIAVPDGLAAGMHAVQVVHKMAMGAEDPKKPTHPGFESNIGNFVLHPRIKLVKKTMAPSHPGGAAGPALKVTLDLTVKKTQRAILLLNGTTAAKPVARSFNSQPLQNDSTAVTFPIPGLPAGKYFIAVQVDGATSPLDLDPGSTTFGPTVTVP